VDVKPAGKEPTLRVGGLLQAQAEFGDRLDSRWDNGNDRFFLRRARINAQGRFLEEFEFRFEADAAGTLSSTTGLRLQLTDGYIDWKRYTAASVRVGQFKTPFGYEQLYPDPRLLTPERSLPSDRLTFSRQLGLQVGGELLDSRLSYAAGLFNGNGANNSGNDNDQFLYAARVAGILHRGTFAGRTRSSPWERTGSPPTMAP
jgi:phosphate-selective porin